MLADTPQGKARTIAAGAVGSGGQVTLIGRHGSNVIHGALYEYLQNNDLNSNTWDNNRAHLPKAIIHDNRFGGRLGGPIIKNKLFFFVNYEKFTRIAPALTAGLNPSASDVAAVSARWLSALSAIVSIAMWTPLAAGCAHLSADTIAR
jgi:hypothetical protein